MSCCCNEVVDIGCYNWCEEIDTGYDATQNGTHQFQAYVVSGTLQTIAVAGLVIGDDLVIPAGILNESKAQDIRIIQPDGTQYEFTTDIYCLRLTTLVYIT